MPLNERIAILGRLDCNVCKKYSLQHMRLEHQLETHFVLEFGTHFVLEFGTHFVLEFGTHLVFEFGTLFVLDLRHSFYLYKLEFWFVEESKIALTFVFYLRMNLGPLGQAFGSERFFHLRYEKSVGPFQ